MTSLTASLSPSLTGGLAQLLHEKPIETADYEVAAMFTLDAVANAVAGLSTPQGEIIRAWADGRAMDAGRQAFVMGALTHILEVDDLHKASVVHPGCVAVPAAWILAQKCAASGRELLRAVLWGFEAATRIGMAVGPGHYRIWHNTATCGPFGSAAAAGALLSLSEEQLIHAFGNAGTQSAGLWEFIESGAMTKHLHAGRGAEAGIVAAELAKLGFTGPPHILEGARGFFAATCSDANPRAVLADPGHRWQIHETSIKPWPCCRHTHPAIDAAQHLRRKLAESNRSPSDISSIKIETYRAALNLCHEPDPDTEYAAKFSLQHCIAAALSHENVTFESFGGRARAELAPLRSRVELILSERFDSAYPARWGSSVELCFADGTVLTQVRQDALGDPESPLSLDQVVDKAGMLLRHGGINEPEPLIASILALASDGPLPDLGLPA